MAQPLEFANAAAFNTYYDGVSDKATFHDKVPDLLINLHNWQKQLTKPTKNDIDVLKTAQEKIVKIVGAARATAQQKVQQLKGKKPSDALQKEIAKLDEANSLLQILSKKSKTLFQKRVQKTEKEAAPPTKGLRTQMLEYTLDIDAQKFTNKDVSQKLSGFLQDFEKLQQHSPATSNKLSKVSLGRETEYGPSHSGSLARSSFVRAHDALEAANYALSTETDPKKTASQLMTIGSWLGEAAVLQGAAQAKKVKPPLLEGSLEHHMLRAAQLISLRELVAKAEIVLFTKLTDIPLEQEHLTATDRAVLEQKLEPKTKAALNKLCQELGLTDTSQPFSAEQLQNITTDELIQHWKAILPSLSEVEELGWPGFNALAEELTKGLETLPDYQAQETEW